MIFRPGNKTNETFPCEIIRRLPGGGMAEIYLASLQNTEHLMVVKGVSRKVPDSRWEALKKEAELLKRVRLETIPEMYGFWEEENKRYFVMSYYDGVNLEKLLVQKSISERMVKEIGLSLCETLAYLHQKGIVYGDLKPSNLLWCDDHIVLLDFGTAIWKGDVENETLFQGTLNYAASEWFMGGKITYLADVFSLGATLNRLLEGNEQKKNRWKSVLGKCCALEPENRFQSMAHIYEAIHKIQV